MKKIFLGIIVFVICVIVLLGLYLTFYKKELNHSAFLANTKKASDITFVKINEGDIPDLEIIPSFSSSESFDQVFDQIKSSLGDFAETSIVRSGENIYIIKKTYTSGFDAIETNFTLYYFNQGHLEEIFKKASVNYEINFPIWNLNTNKRILVYKNNSSYGVAPDTDYSYFYPDGNGNLYFFFFEDIGMPSAHEAMVSINKNLVTGNHVLAMQDMGDGTKRIKDILTSYNQDSSAIVMYTNANTNTTYMGIYYRQTNPPYTLQDIAKVALYKIK